MTNFVIRSNDEADDETDEALYWSNVDGWVDRASATVFTLKETKHLDLPSGDCSWEEVK